MFEGLSGRTALPLAGALVRRPIALPAASAGIIDVDLARLELDERSALHDVHVRILLYGDDLFDVEVNFILRDAESVSSESVIDALHRYAIVLSQRYDVVSYYAGIDPASDEDTRFFTGTERGPASRSPSKG